MSMRIEVAMQASDIMTRDPRCCSRSDSLKTVARIMLDENVGEVPVVDEQHRLVGIITDGDIVIRCVAEGNPHARPTFFIMSRCRTDAQDRGRTRCMHGEDVLSHGFRKPASAPQASGCAWMGCHHWRFVEQYVKAARATFFLCNVFTNPLL
jgi:CBS domain